MSRAKKCGLCRGRGQVPDPTYKGRDPAWITCPTCDGSGQRDHPGTDMKQEDAFAEGLKRLIARHPSLQIDVDWETGIAILACLQLSLRHPGNRGHSAGLAREFCDRIISGVESVEPELAALLRLGDDPRHDRKAGGA